MDNLLINKLKRNPEKIQSLLKVTGDITTALDNLYVIFPERFIDRKLAFIDSEVKVLMCCAILDDSNNYALINAPIFQTLTPSNISNVKCEDDTYKLLSFKANTVIIPNNNTILTDNFMYDVFDEFFIKGKIPWYLNYEDVSNVFLESKKYAGSNIGNNPLIFEMLTSIITRLDKDKKIYLRHILTKENKNKIQSTYIGLNNPYYSFDNTGARLIGSRFGAGLNVALVEPETKTSATTEILRS